MNRYKIAPTRRLRLPTRAASQILIASEFARHIDPGALKSAGVGAAGEHGGVRGIGPLVTASGSDSKTEAESEQTEVVLAAAPRSQWGHADHCRPGGKNKIGRRAVSRTVGKWLSVGDPLR